jgi:hypothetical protein
MGYSVGRMEYNFDFFLFLCIGDGHRGSGRLSMSNVGIGNFDIVLGWNEVIGNISSECSVFEFQTFMEYWIRRLYLVYNIIKDRLTYRLNLIIGNFRFSTFFLNNSINRFQNCK